MKITKRFVAFLLLILLTFNSSLETYAGVNSGSSTSNPGSSSGGSGGALAKGPLYWVIYTEGHSSATYLKDTVHKVKPEIYLEANTPVAYVTSSTYKPVQSFDYAHYSNWFNFDASKGGLRFYLVGNWTGSSLPSQFVKEANNHGYSDYNNSSNRIFYNGSKYADAIWLEPTEVWAARSKSENYYSIVKFYNANDEDQSFDNTEKDAEWHYKNQKTSIDISYISKEKEYRYDHTLYVTVQKFTLKTTWEENNFGEKQNIKYEYTSNESERDMKYASWRAKSTEIEEKYFKFLDLRTEDVASNELIKDLYGQEFLNKVSDKAIDADVENYKDIIDKENPKNLTCLDNNSPIKFSLKFNNEQFGIPTAAEGGIDIQDSMPEAPTEISEITNETIYWSPVFYMSSTNHGYYNKRTSLEFNGKEKRDSTAFEFNKVFLGGDFLFRSIKSGTYYLGGYSSSQKIPTVVYHATKFYKYGSKYETTVTIGSSLTPEWTNKDGRNSILVEDNNIYIGEASSTIEQPILYAPFDVKTVGGYAK